MCSGEASVAFQKKGELSPLAVNAGIPPTLGDLDRLSHPCGHSVGSQNIPVGCDCWDAPLGGSRGQEGILEPNGML
jgi:hypothetical protein